MKEEDEQNNSSEDQHETEGQSEVTQYNNKIHKNNVLNAEQSRVAQMGFVISAVTMFLIAFSEIILLFRCCKERGNERGVSDVTGGKF